MYLRVPVSSPIHTEFPLIAEERGCSVQYRHILTFTFPVIQQLTISMCPDEIVRSSSLCFNETGAVLTILICEPHIKINTSPLRRPRSTFPHHCSRSTES